MTAERLDLIEGSYQRSGVIGANSVSDLVEALRIALAALERIEKFSNSRLGVGAAHDNQVFESIAVPGRQAREARQKMEAH